MMFIETADQYRQLRQTRQAIELTGKRGQKILVPCMNTVIVGRELVRANTYNPNSMPDQKQEDLIESIKLAGLAYPVAAWWDDDLEQFIVVDGFHRYLVMGYDHLGLSHVPVVPLDHLTPSGRMMATWLFNKARGFHQVDLDAELIRSLIEQGMEEDEIASTLGIDLETVWRYKQVTGIAELFKNAIWSMPWTVQEHEA